MIDKAKELAERKGVLDKITFVKGALEDLKDFDDKSFDMVISFPINKNQFILDENCEDPYVRWCLSKVKILRLGETEGFQWFTIMGFESGFASLTFCSVEDFRTYCEYFGIQCDFQSLGDGSLILSEKLARNRGLEIGDMVNRDTTEAVYGNYSVKAFTQEDGYLQYYINEEAADSCCGRISVSIEL